MSQDQGGTTGSGTNKNAVRKLNLFVEDGALNPGSVERICLDFQANRQVVGRRAALTIDLRCPRCRFLKRRLKFGRTIRFSGRQRFCRLLQISPAETENARVAMRASLRVIGKLQGAERQFHLFRRTARLNLRVGAAEGAGVDLVPDSFAISPVAVVAGEGITVEVAVKNQGRGTSGHNFVVFLVLSTDLTATVEDDTLLGGLEFKGIGSRATKSESDTFAVPVDIAEGSYFIGAIVDFENSITESNEDNNSAVSLKPIQVTVPVTAAFTPGR